MAVPPDESGRLFVVDQIGVVRVVSPTGGLLEEPFAVSANPARADPDSERVVLQVDQPQSNHNGGTLAFGPDDGHLTPRSATAAVPTTSASDTLPTACRSTWAARESC